MKNILFVCTGNTCRSSMAEAIANHLVRQKGLAAEFSFVSAGTGAWEGCPASPNAIEAVKEYGLDLSFHKAKKVNSSLIVKADLILTMTKGHKAQVAALFPASLDKLYTLYEYLGYKGKDIEDPIGGDLAVYQACARELKEAIEKLLDKLQLEWGGA